MRRIGGSLVVAVALGAALTLSALPASAGRAAPATGVLLSTIQQRAATSISLRRTTIEQLESLVAGTRSFAGDDGSMLAGRLRIIPACRAGCKERACPRSSSAREAADA